MLTSFKGRYQLIPSLPEGLLELPLRNRGLVLQNYQITRYVYDSYITPVTISFLFLCELTALIICCTHFAYKCIAPQYNDTCVCVHTHTQKEFPIYPPAPLNLLVPTLDEQGLDLLQQHLVCNPIGRITAEEAMSHDYFHDIDPSI